MALGRILAELVTGRPEFDPADRATVSPAVAAAIDRCLKDNPGDRWPTAAALAAALDGSSRPTSRRRGWVAVVAVVVMAIAVVIGTVRSFPGAAVVPEPVSADSSPTTPEPTSPEPSTRPANPVRSWRAAVFAIVRNDLNARPVPAGRQRVYLTAAHLTADPTVTPAEVTRFRDAVAAFDRHLDPDESTVRRVAADDLLYAVDLVEWPTWLTSAYPYGLTHESAADGELRSLAAAVRDADGDVLIVRADWLLRTAARRLARGEPVFGTVTPPPEALSDWADGWDARPVGLETATAELGVDSSAVVRAAIAADPRLGTTLGLAPLADGRAVDRAVWENADFVTTPFQELARATGIGTPVTRD